MNHSFEGHLLTPPHRQIPLEKILADEELHRRPARLADYKAEAEALSSLAEVLASSVEVILQKLSDAALHLTGADSAGVSIAEKENEKEIFRWRGIAGELSPFLMGTMPRDFSPCGHVLATKTHHLMVEMIGHYQYVSQLGLPLYEVLLVPFAADGKLVGTIWAVAHTPAKKFDREDLRVLTSLTKFASAGYQAMQTRDEAVRANQLKSSFLANMSHEIRTPLGAMLGFAELMKDPALSQAERMNFAEILARNGEQLSYIINDILDLSKVEAGHLSFDYAPVSPIEIAKEIVALLQVKANEKNVSLEYHRDETTPPSIVTDEFRLKQILTNIIGNALKFTTKGFVKIRSSSFATENSSGVRFDVEDTGVGMAPEQKDRLFEMFAQGDGTVTKKFGGTGLGLALSRRLARAMGGDVSILKTVEGEGTTFRVEIANC